MKLAEKNLAHRFYTYFQIHLAVLHSNRKRLQREARNNTLTPTQWSSCMHACRRSKKEMQVLVRDMENILRPYSPWLQENRGGRK